MSVSEIAWTKIELDCSSRKRHALLFAPPEVSEQHSETDAGRLACAAAAPAVSENDQSRSPHRNLHTLDSEKPLLIAFHGGSGQAEQMERLSGFMSLAARENFFVVYPQGINRHWNDGRNLPTRREIDDVEFVVKLIEHLRQSYPIDRQRVYACGISNGGFFVQYLAARAPGILAAIASVAATVHEPMYREVKPPEPVPIMFVIGKDDPVVPFAGGDIELASRKAGLVVSAEDSFNYWAAANHANSEFEDESLPALRPADLSDQTRVWRRSYSAMEDGKPVVALIIEGGGHAWPGGWQYYREKYIGKTSQQLDATGEILKFFNAFRRS